MAEVIRRHGFYSLYRSQCWYVVIIELSKLFRNSQNQMWNYYKLYRKFRNENMAIDLLKLFEANKQGKDENDSSHSESTSSREELLNIIDQEEEKLGLLKDIVNSVNIYRDNLYAHYDGNLVLNVNLDFDQLNELVKFSRNTFNMIFGRIDRIDYGLDAIFGADIGDLIRIEQNRSQGIEFYYQLVDRVNEEEFDRNELRNFIMRGFPS